MNDDQSTDAQSDDAKAGPRASALDWSRPGKLVIEILPNQTFLDQPTASVQDGGVPERLIRRSTGIVETFRTLVRDPTPADYMALSLRPELLWDGHLIGRIAAEIAYFSESKAPWLMLAAHGRDRRNKEYLSAWFDAECNLTPTRGRAQVVLASGLLYVVNLTLFRRYIGSILASPQLEDVMNAVISLGYLDQVPSYFSSRLFPILLGKKLLPDIAVADAIACTCSLLHGNSTVPDGDPSLRERLKRAYDGAVDLAKGRPVFSFVIRTIFKRHHMLYRCLISIDYIRRALGVPVEIVIASDVETATSSSALNELQKSFLGLAFTFADASGQPGHSRVKNLKAGVRATTGEWVCIIDDDDFYLPLAASTLARVLEPGFDGILLLDSQIVNEEWTEAPHKHERQVLSYGTVFAARHWMTIYTGSNSLPLCSIVYPGGYARRVIEEYSFDHDLSEDFLLHLRVFSDPQRPSLHVTDGISVHQSHRTSSDNVSTMLDRTAWCLDTGNGVYDLLIRGGRQFEDLTVSERAAAELAARQQKLSVREQELQEALDAARRQLTRFIAAWQEAERERAEAPSSSPSRLPAAGSGDRPSIASRLFRKLRSVP